MITRNNKRYFITFKDDCSYFTFIYFLKNESDAFNMFKVFVTEVENKFNKKIKRLRSDKETKYNYFAFTELYNSKGIIHEKIASYSPENSGKKK